MQPGSAATRPLVTFFFCAGRALAFARAAFWASDCLRPPFFAAARALRIAATSTGAADGMPSAGATFSSGGGWAEVLRLLVGCALGGVACTVALARREYASKDKAS